MICKLLDHPFTFVKYETWLNKLHAILSTIRKRFDGKMISFVFVLIINGINIAILALFYSQKSIKILFKNVR